MFILRSIYNRLLCKFGLTTELELTRVARNQFEDKYLRYGHFPEITDAELKLYQETWPMWNIEKKDLTWARVYKKEWGFSPYVIGNWHTLLLRNKVNPYEQLSSFENKALCDIYFPEIPYPKAYVRRLQGVYYNEKMDVISKEEAISLLASIDSYVIKPAFGTMQGEGVQVVLKEKIQDNYKDFVCASIDEQTTDFIAQERLTQHPDIAKLNPTSLNCCRVTTIYIDGKFGHATNLKIGKKGSNVDNWYSSYFCGVDKEGRVMKRGYAKDLQCVTQTDSGISLDSIVIPNYQEMVQMLESFHKKFFPNCGVIGWDITIDNKSEIRIIEANLTKPGIVAEQLAVGDFFKDFSAEINKLFK